jgi:hypothetical protein
MNPTLTLTRTSHHYLSVIVKRKERGCETQYEMIALYYHCKDQAAGNTNGQAVAQVWCLISPTGSTIDSVTDPTPTTRGKPRLRFF